MNGTTEGSAASRPAVPSGGDDQTATVSDWTRAGGRAPAEGKAEVKQNMAPRVMPTSADMAGAAVFLSPEQARTITGPNPLWANAASLRCLTGRP